MNELTISQIQKVLGWSYPTALNFAKANGRQESGERGQWFVQAHIVESELVKRETELNQRRDLFSSFLVTPA